MHEEQIDMTEAAPTEAPKEVIKETVVERKGGFFPMLLGGVAAAAIGFGATSYYYQTGPFAASGATGDFAAQFEESEAERTAAQEALSARIDELANAVPATPDTSAIEERIAAVEGNLQSLDTRLTEALTALEQRMTDMEQRPVEAASDAAVSAFENEVNTLRQEVAAQKEEIENMAKEAVEAEAAAEETSRQAMARAALTRVQSALDAGAPYETALADLRANTGADIAASLAGPAADGIPSLTQLIDAYPAHAREALADTRAETADGGAADRVSAFLMNQLGARSLEPKEGDGTDAILSRAEAALKEARLTDALAELDGLPEVAQPAMAPWIEMARTRQDALAAAESLAQTLNN
jgi:hypothetical protein